MANIPVVKESTKKLAATADYLKLTMSYADYLGIDSIEVFRKAGLDSRLMEDPDACISAHVFNTIWNTMEGISTDRNLGLHIGELVSNFPGHILFLLMLNAPTIRDAIEKFCQYFNLMTDFLAPAFSVDKDTAVISAQFHVGDIPVTRHTNESILSAFASILHRISESRIRFDGIYFSHAEPDDTTEHKRIFQAPLHFNQEKNRLVFSDSYLDLPILLSNEETLKTLEHLAERLQKKIYTAGPWSEKVIRQIMIMLQGDKPDITGVAGKLAVSPRSLQNYLKNEGVTYQKLLEDVRREQAVHLLENESASITEISFLLGYSEQSIFSKAFKRWTGKSPSRYRMDFAASSVKPQPYGV